MTNYKLDMQKRDKVGSNAVRKLRVKEMVPGVIYGKDLEPINVCVDEKELRKVHLMAGTSSLIDVKVDGEDHTVIIREVQKHPFKLYTSWSWTIATTSFIKHFSFLKLLYID